MYDVMVDQKHYFLSSLRRMILSLISWREGKLWRCRYKCFLSSGGNPGAVHCDPFRHLWQVFLQLWLSIKSTRSRRSTSPASHHLEYPFETTNFNQLRLMLSIAVAVHLGRTLQLGFSPTSAKMRSKL